jgi:hypothetical protein
MGIENIEILIDTEGKEGVWVVYDYDTRAYPLNIFKEEIEAHRYREKLGYGYVRFMEFGIEWGDY